jgi:hypothetical protein
VGYVVGKLALEQVFSEYFGFPCQFAFHRLLHIHHHHHHPGLVQSGLVARRFASLIKNFRSSPQSLKAKAEIKGYLRS